MRTDGLALGIGTTLLGTALDRQQERLPPSELMLSATNLALVNLLVAGPLMHRWALQWTRPRRWFRRGLDALSIVTIHSALYTIAHKCMHKLACLRGIHRDHHKFKKVVVPSAANAVSLQEFLFAYMSPFCVATVLLRPDVVALNSAVAIVSVCNLLVHSPHLRETEWPACFVAPAEHLEHHATRKSAYSAPTWTWDAFSFGP